MLWISCHVWVCDNRAQIKNFNTQYYIGIQDMILKLILVVKTIKNFHTAFLDKLGFIHGTIIYKIRNSPLQVYARGGTEDMAEIVVVISGDEYDLKPMDLPSRPIVFDLGAHIGAFSLYMTFKIKKRCEIFAFEPDDGNYQILNQNIQKNKIKSVHINKLAISDYTGKGFLEKRNLNTDAYHLEFSKKRKVAKNCNVSTIINAAKNAKVKKIDILKMDIEGAEYSIFLHKQSLNFIKENVRYIFMEFHNISKDLNYTRIEKIINKNFQIIGRRKNVLTLRSLSWKAEVSRV